MDTFAWTDQLKCPSYLCTNEIKRRLNKGILGLLWEDISGTLFPANEVLQARKNLLLYKLKNEPDDPLIQSVKKIVHLSTEREKLGKQIVTSENMCESHDYTLRRKEQQLKKIKSTRHSTQVKKDLLKMKYNQMCEQVRDCEQMNLVCKHLMPPLGNSIEQTLFKNCLTLVSTLSSGGNRKHVWRTISETLSPIKMGALWTTLLENCSKDADEFIRLRVTVPERNVACEHRENIDVGLARISGQHISSVGRKLIHDADTCTQKQQTMEYIYLIENAETNLMEIEEWLSVTLEVRKLELMQERLQEEVNEISEAVNERRELTVELAHIVSEIQNVDVQIKEHVEEVQHSLMLLKTAGSLIDTTKEELQNKLQNIMALRTKYQDAKWLDINLSAELIEFYDNMDIAAVRKIILGGNIGAYRHSTCCIGNAPISTIVPQYSNNVSRFPMILAPIHHLIQCHHDLMTNALLKRYENHESSFTEEELIEPISPEEQSDKSCSAMELLNIVDLTCDNIHDQIQQFNSISTEWANQSVQQILIHEHRSINGVTFKEWLQRYNTLVYMLHKCK
ncbi:uncharacterized protein LOC105702677 [Orussus abietinus]|uniref:uncharacterized protein LOC105702677 n=1 Tax=Orussus abietinus TaxID=222816 RepID=UPI0006266341|nr:uncharacterized protein LOC105702677 [Orussus abietinus]XP_012285828.1 uncharacterized protein LOC105702677 [Orussus abietinus]XP_012285829.1 uncharacterized protein LOC105702677 [Orussus abietinus]XP_023288433.1 uncharacterized protein LOC105702677 [Orussus abietinus]XP_023288434.1 uncharacterized protein LOC105702677 [Orussus abietinus]